MKALVAFLCLLPGLAWGQAAVQQSGPVTNNSPVMWSRDHVIRQGAGESGDVAGKMATGGTATVGKVCSFSNTTDAATYSKLCLSSSGEISLTNTGTANIFTFNRDGVIYNFPGSGQGTVVGPNTSILDNIMCWNNTSGTLAKDCSVIGSRSFWSNTVTGNVGANLVGGVEIASNTNTAISQTDIGKINALYVNNTFGAAAGEGQRASIFGKLTQNGAAAWTSLSYQYNTGIWSWVLVNQGNTTLGQEPNYMGYAGLVELGGTNTRANNIVGMEVDVNIGPTVVAGNRIGVLAAIGAGTFGAPTRAIGFDGAYAIGRGTSSEASWRYGYMARGPDGVWPFANDSILFGGLGASNSAGGVAALAGTGIDLTGITFTFQEYISDHFQIDADGRIFVFGGTPHVKLRDTAVAVTAGGLTRWASFGAGQWCEQINTAVAGDFSTAINSWCMQPTGEIGFSQKVLLGEKTVATLGTCDATVDGRLYFVKDANATAFGAVLTGGGGSRRIAMCNGGASQWEAH